MLDSLGYSFSQVPQDHKGGAFVNILIYTRVSDGLVRVSCSQRYFAQRKKGCSDTLGGLLGLSGIFLHVRVFSGCHQTLSSVSSTPYLNSS